MDISVLLWLILAAIAISVFLSAKFKINIGIVGFVFAYVIGVFCLGMSTKQVATNFPTNIFLQMLLVPAFFSVGIKNGTLSLFADKILYKFRHKPALVPFVFLLIGLIMGLFGAGAPTINVVLAVMVFNVGLAMGLSPWLCLVTICFGANLGTFVPWGSYGVMVSKTIEEWLPGMGTSVSWKMVIAWGLFTAIIWFAIWGLTKGSKVAGVSVEEPEKFNPVQKRTLAMIVAYVSLLLLPTLLKIFLPGAKIVSKLQTWFSAEIIAAFGVLIYMLIMPETKKQILNEGIPWSTALMVSGICTLLNIATNNGVTDYIGSFLSENVAAFWMPVVFCLLGAFLSCFAGAIMTVTPLLGAIAVPYAQAVGISPVPLLLAIMVGASATAISPLSSGGALMLGICPSEKVREESFNRCLALAGIGTVISTILSMTLFRIL